MPIQLSSFLLPRNGNKYFLVEDVYVKGGYQIVENAAERDSILPGNRKAGMLVRTKEDKVIWELDSDLVSWSELKLGGGSAASLQHWSITTRSLDPGESIVEPWSGAGLTLLLQKVEVSAPVMVEVFGNEDLLDSNPYKFQATDNHLSDDGTTLMSDGLEYKNRRYSIVSNNSTPERSPNLWVRITNNEAATTAVTLDIDYLVIEQTG